jgi:hypothetical protein
MRRCPVCLDAAPRGGAHVALCAFGFGAGVGRALFGPPRRPDAPAPPRSRAPPDTYEGNLELQASLGGAVVVRAADVDRAAPLGAAPEPAGDDACPICLEPMARAGAVRRGAGCGHAFCAGCLETWLSASVACPVCKRDLAAGDGGGSLAVHPPRRPRAPEALLMLADLDEVASALALWVTWPPSA